MYLAVRQFIINFIGCFKYKEPLFIELAVVRVQFEIDHSLNQWLDELVTRQSFDYCDNRFRIAMIVLESFP